MGLRRGLVAVVAAFALAAVASGWAGPQSETGGRYTKDEIAELNRTFACECDDEPVSLAAVPVLVVGYRPIYPAPRLQTSSSGGCLVHFTVAVDGTTGGFSAAGDKMMCDHSIIAMRYWRFQPGIVDGTPHASDLTMRFAYSIR